MIYLFIGIYLVILSYYFDFRHHKNGRKFHYLAILIILILLAGFRYRLGIDTVRYEMSFRDLPTLNQLSMLEFQEHKYDPLYLFLSSLCHSISKEFWVMQMAQATLVNVIFLRFFKKNTSNVFFAILIYYIVLYIPYMCETMRESCAVAMVLLGWEYLKENRRFGFVVYSILAFLFHSSSIILVIVCFLVITGLYKRIKFSSPTIVAAILVLVLSSIVQIVFGDVLELIAFNSRLADKVETQIVSGHLSSKLNIFGLLSVAIAYGIVPYICAMSLRGTKHSKQLEFFLIVEMFCAAFAYPIAIFYRYVNYFTPFVILAICKTLSMSSYTVPLVGKLRTSTFYIWFLLILPFVIGRARYLLQDDAGTEIKTYARYYPYSSIFTKERDFDRENLYTYMLMN